MIIYINIITITNTSIVILILSLLLFVATTSTTTATATTIISVHRPCSRGSSRCLDAAARWVARPWSNAVCAAWLSRRVAPTPSAAGCAQSPSTGSSSRTGSNGICNVSRAALQLKKRTRPHVSMASGGCEASRIPNGFPGTPNLSGNIRATAMQPLL